MACDKATHATIPMQGLLCSFKDAWFLQTVTMDSLWLVKMQYDDFLEIVTSSGQVRFTELHSGSSTHPQVRIVIHMLQEGFRVCGYGMHHDITIYDFRVSMIQVLQCIL